MPQSQIKPKGGQEVMDKMTSIDDPLQLVRPVLTMSNYFGFGSPDSLAEVIKRQEGWNAPDSKTKRNNNPGALFDANGKFRKFKTFKEGWSALMKDMKIKARGKSSVVKPTASIEDFVNMYVAGGDTTAYKKKYPGHLKGYKKALGG